MFLHFFFALREARLPVTLPEFLTLLEGLEKGVAGFSPEDFYYLARAVLIKDERLIDRFDRVFATIFQGLGEAGDGGGESVTAVDLPLDWLRAMAERLLTEEEKAAVRSRGGFEALVRDLMERLREQKGRHQGGSKWIGTGGTSPFGAYGYNPEGVRVGQDRSRHRRAVKVWDRRDFRDFDDARQLDIRGFQMALRRLRRFARQGAACELDLDGTIEATARRGGLLELQMQPERHNAARLLLFLDVGGSMDDHVTACEQLFSAARAEFKHLEHFYFHNCVYDAVWRDNRRRYDQALPLEQVLRTYSADYRLVLVGDAAMSPYELFEPGGAIDSWNEEAGAVWLGRLLQAFPRTAWLNPLPPAQWRWTPSIGMVGKLLEGRMYPLTLQGLEEAMRALSR